MKHKEIAVQAKLVPELVSKTFEPDFIGYPHQDVPGTDLTVIPRLIRSDGTERRITNAEKEKNHLTDAEIMRTAMGSVLDRDTADVRFLNEIIGSPEKEPRLLVVTNTDKRFGASEILNPKVQKDAAEKLGGDFFILPSSRHEVILAPADGYSAEALKSIVREANTLVLDPVDILSDQVYRYDSQKKKIVMAVSEKEKRVSGKQISPEKPKIHGRTM